MKNLQAIIVIFVSFWMENGNKKEFIIVINVNCVELEAKNRLFIVILVVFVSALLKKKLTNAKVQNSV